MALAFIGGRNYDEFRARFDEPVVQAPLPTPGKFANFATVRSNPLAPHGTGTRLESGWPTGFFVNNYSAQPTPRVLTRTPIPTSHR